jgi:dephospho-CoA kinase
MKLKDRLVKLSPETRLYKLETPIVGLTGGIASGKSTVSRALARKGFPVIDADQLVKDIYALPEALEFIAQNFPEAISDGKILFPTLRQKVFLNRDSKETIERFIYQRLPEAFLKAYAQINKPECIIYDVPLLFEKNLQSQFDINVLVYAPRKIQRARLMTRDGHLEEMANNILNQQMDIEEKKLKAQFFIDNSQTEEDLAENINQFLRQSFI